jgi:predicted nuclease of predicted toxin-antitoxin system
MTHYLIDENLPYYFKLWDNNKFVHVYDIPGLKTDNEIWDYAKKNNLIIVSKDADFSNKIMYKTPPPKVIHIRYGNVRIQKLHELLDTMWSEIEKEIQEHKLVNVFLDRIESIS